MLIEKQGFKGIIKNNDNYTNVHFAPAAICCA